MSEKLEIGNADQQAVIDNLIATLDPNIELLNTLKQILKVPDYISFYPIPVGSSVDQFEVQNLPGPPNFFALVCENSGEGVLIVPGSVPANGAVVNRPTLSIFNTTTGAGTFTLDTPKLPYTTFSIRCLDFVSLTNFVPYLIVGYKNPLR
jgi:hypothetical protein